jgi:hypothetical protein
MAELQPYLIYFASAFAVLIAMLLLVALFRALRRRPRATRGDRLGISEYCEIDETRRLILLRRDDVEHLVMIGGPQDVVIESGIGDEQQSARHPLDEAVAAAVMRHDDVVPFRAAPRAPVFGGKRPTLRSVDDTPDGDGPKRA